MKKIVSKYKKILVIGAGPIVIGQAGEFDYSGTQACKSLMEEGIEVVLLNSNPATIMTDHDTATTIYIEAINERTALKIIEKERPQAILPNVGGQTSLNLAISLHKKGILKKYNIDILCSDYQAIMNAEDRGSFASIVQSLGFKVPKYRIINKSSQIEEVFNTIGVPAVVRPSFTLGGSGGGIVKTKEEFFKQVKEGLETSPNSTVQVDESLIGWKEIELELMKDERGDSIVVCGIENIDPMGVHTGDSITVSPIMNIRDREYQLMRDFSIKLLDSIGMKSGGANVQFAYNIKDGSIRVIEMNPRVSRSSALASKATGYPISFITAKLALGYSLKDVFISNNNGIKSIPAFFEPTMDYVVTKIPRFNFEKFDYSKNSAILSSTMHSVGEVMAVGSNFIESLHKAYQSLENGLYGLEQIVDFKDEVQIKEKLSVLSPDRLRYIADALRYGMCVEKISEITGYDIWFLKQIKKIVDIEQVIAKKGIDNIDAHDLFNLKKLGFSDNRIEQILDVNYDDIYNLRIKLNIRANYNYIDSCSGEFEHRFNCLYSSYRGNLLNKAYCELEVLNKKKVIVLGSGPNRIGQGIEFDYVCVQAINTIKQMGYEAIMVNCNPETVSTDFTLADKLYIVPITLEHVRDIVERESKNGELLGLILQFGGQTPLNLAKQLENLNIPILGTCYEKIDQCEDRNRFQNLINDLNLLQPKNIVCYNRKKLLEAIELVGFPLILRPSYVLGGQSMNVIYDESMLNEYLNDDKIDQYLIKGGILVDQFLAHAVEVDIDAICDGEEVFIAGISEHIEEAGIHSGDSSCSLPSRTLSKNIISNIRKNTISIAKKVGIVGFLNIQMAIKNNNIYILEVNPRASRTIPFVSKTIGMPLSNFSTRVLLGEKINDIKGLNMNFKVEDISWFGVKCPVFSFVKFPKSDVLLGPEMKSTGEVMAIDDNFGTAFLKAYEGCGNNLFTTGNIFISVKKSDRENALYVARQFYNLGFNIFATKGTSSFLQENGIYNVSVNKVKQGSPNVVEMILENKFNLIINTSTGRSSTKDSFSIRSTALLKKCPSITNIQYAKTLADAIQNIKKKDLNTLTIDHFYKK